MSMTVQQGAKPSGRGRAVGKSPTRLAFERFSRNPLAMGGLFVLTVIVLMTICAPLLTHYSPTVPNIMDTDMPPSPAHLLGTDGSGYDNLTRLLYGGRTDLTIGFAAAILTFFIGTIYGGISGYFGGWVDMLMMRFVDVMLNFPFIILVLVLESILDAQGVWILITVLSVTSWPGPARFIRGIFLQLREQDYVTGATTIGASPMRIIFRHIFPNTLSSVLVLVSFAVAGYLGVNAGLSFIGFGVPATVPSWGGMLNATTGYMDLTTEPYAWAPPAIMLVLCILSVNFISDGLVDAFNPQSRS